MLLHHAVESRLKGVALALTCQSHAKVNERADAHSLDEKRKEKYGAALELIEDLIYLILCLKLVIFIIAFGKLNFLYF